TIIGIVDASRGDRLRAYEGRHRARAELSRSSDTPIRMRRGLLLLTAVLAAQPLLAWGEKGHYIVNEAATMSLPTDMPPFFYRAFPQLVWLAYDPDRWRGAGPSLDAANPPDHFLDYEYIATLNLPPDRYKFIDLLGTSGT